jgi:hypothetical protein
MVSIHRVYFRQAQSVPITTKIVSLNPTHGEVYYLIQHYVIKFVSDLLQISDFPWVLLFSPPVIRGSTDQRSMMMSTFY